MVGTDVEVVLREVLDEKGRRLVVSSAHVEVEGAKVDAINGILVSCISDVERAMKEVPSCERGTLLLGEVKKELEPVEPGSDIDSKKASPLFQAPDDAAAAAARLRELAESTDGPELSLTTPGEDAQSASPEPVKLTVESPKPVNNAPPSVEPVTPEPSLERDSEASPAKSSEASPEKDGAKKPARRIIVCYYCVVL